MILGILIISLVFRLSFMSPWLEDWDSVQFALALDEYSLVSHQPHPPGYPIYIILGKMVNFFLDNSTLSLSLLSALAGALSIIPFFLLAKKLIGKKGAILASLIFTILPIHWVLSEIPITNITGLLGILTSSYLIYSELTNSKKISFAGIVSGILLGIRPTDLPIIAGLLTFLFFKKKQLLFRVSLFFGFLTGVAIWLIPIILITGFDEFRAINAETSKYFIWHDMLFGKPFSLLTYITDRIANLIRLFNIGFTPLFFIISIISIITTTKKIPFLFIYLISYLTPLVFIYNLELPQYTLPLAGVLPIFVTVFLTRILPKKLFTTTYIILLAVLFQTSFNTIIYQKKMLPPTIEPVYFIKANYKTEETLLITTYTFRQFQYYAPEYKNFYGKNNTPRKIDDKFVVIDYIGLAREIDALSHYEVVEQKNFGPSKNEFVRLPSTTLTVLRNKTPKN